MALRQAGAILAQAFKAAYEYIGILMLSNFVWFLAAFLPILLFTMLPWQHPVFFLFGVLGTVVLFGPATAGIHTVIYRLVQREEATLTHFRAGFVRFFGRSFLLALVMGVILGILIVDLWFSLNSPSTWFRLLSGIWVYFIIFWGIMAQFVFPFLVQQDIGVITILKRSSLLAMDNILVSVVITLVNTVILAVSVLLAAPILLFVMGLTAFVQHFALLELLKKYDEQEQDTNENENGQGM